VPALDPEFSQALAARLRFYRDLGLTDFYRRPVTAGAESTHDLGASAPAGTWDPTSPTLDPQSTHELRAPSLTTVAPPSRVADVSSIPASQELDIPPRKPIFTPSAAPAVLPVQDRASALQIIRDEIGDCTRCALHTGRNKIVFADGPPDARLMFVGEGPGADEDAQGLPFVGKAGQLLNNMITAMGFRRDQVYIANVVKCRPPGNRTPEPDEANTCSPFLFQQIDVIRPEVLVALGATAATYLLGQRQPLAGLRGRVHPFRGTKLIVTYHPAFLLRDPRQKKEAWADLQIAMRELAKPTSR
jgi:uracil-DNA glycosylase